MWISVEDRIPELPINCKVDVFLCKVQVGSILPEIIECNKMLKWYPTGIKFIEGDWQKVTHWWEE